jgi:hypothetical protein
MRRTAAHREMRHERCIRVIAQTIQRHRAPGVARGKSNRAIDRDAR